jgi:hypothetical protein
LAEIAKTWAALPLLRFAVRAVNPAVNKVSEKNIDAIERAG